MRDANRLRPIEAQWRTGEQDAALQALADHLARDPQDGAAWGLRGLYLLDKRTPDPALALEALERSLAIAPTYPAAYNAGNALLDLGRLEDALARYDLSIRCFDEYPQAWVNRGIVLHRLARTPEALVSLDRALALDPAFVPALRCKAIAAESTGDKEGSEAPYARIVELRPEDLHALSEYGRALSRLPPDNHMELEPHGREWKAVETLNVVLERNPGDIAAWIAKAEVLFRCMHANVCFRTGVFDYVPGPLRTGTFQGDLVDLLEAAKQRFPDNPAFVEYWAGIREFNGEPEKEV